MKATRNQTAAVRSYLASLGIEIGHVEALEVIARGAGARSRHVMAASSVSHADVPVRDVFEELLTLREDYRSAGSENDTAVDAAIERVQALFPDLFDSADAIEEFLAESETVSVSTEWEAICRAGALRQAFVDAGRTRAAQATALKALVRDCDEFFRSYEEAHAFLTQFDETVKAQEMGCFSRVRYSIEDPVEYPIPHVGQVLAGVADGPAVQSAIASLMRMDPDILIIGTSPKSPRAD